MLGNVSSTVWIICGKMDYHRLSLDSVQLQSSEQKLVQSLPFPVTRGCIQNILTTKQRQSFKDVVTITNITPHCSDWIKLWSITDQVFTEHTLSMGAFPDDSVEQFYLAVSSQFYIISQKQLFYIPAPKN